MGIKIEKGVPVPRQRGKYPFEGMEVGDSFFVAGRDAQNIGGSLSFQKAHRGWKFASRKVEGGVRVWRTE